MYKLDRSVNILTVDSLHTKTERFEVITAMLTLIEISSDMTRRHNPLRPFIRTIKSATPFFIGRGTHFYSDSSDVMTK